MLLAGQPPHVVVASYQCWGMVCRIGSLPPEGGIYSCQWFASYCKPWQPAAAGTTGPHHDWPHLATTVGEACYL